MSRNARRSVVLLTVTLLLVGGAVGTVAAQGDGTGAESEGGVEGAIGAFVEGQGLLGTVAVLGGGILLLTACTEKLIGYLTRASLRLRMSLFALAILFTGFEFDDTILALVFAEGGMEGAALGTALGTGLAIVGVTLALAAIVEPFSVDIPTDYVVLFALGPLFLVPFALAGTLTGVHGVVLLGFFVGAFGYLLVREYQRDTPVFRSTDLGQELRADGGYELPPSLEVIPEDRFVGGSPRAGWVWLGLSILALVGIVFASMLLEAGSEVVIAGTGLDQTVFGATVLTAILTFEDVLLTLEPVRRGIPEIGVGNVIGSVLFSVTGNVGVIMLFSDLTIGPSVLTFHLPAMLLVTTTAAYFFYTKELKRWHGLLLGGLYLGYWVGAVVLFGGVPLGG